MNISISTWNPMALFSSVTQKQKKVIKALLLRKPLSEKIEIVNGMTWAVSIGFPAGRDIGKQLKEQTN